MQGYSRDGRIRDGVRNAFDPEFAPNGVLMAGDNGPDTDYPEELNIIRKGAHYGFPWRLSDVYNPPQFPTYDPAQDRLLTPGF
jgi:glucose/arabinose dehydrogenase